MVLVIALIVVGPERLPGLARTAGLWVGKAKHFISEVKSEINRELAADELKKVLDKQETLHEVYDIMEEAKQVGREIKQDFARLDAGNDNGPDNSKQLQTPADPHISPGSDDKS